MIVDQYKVCFICCTNDGMYEKECRSYLERLNVPDGMQVEIEMIHGATSMASGYNLAMRQSDAKYKVYLHQDTFLLHIDFIYEMLEIFSDEQVGMFGVVGGIDLPKNGIIYSVWNCGRIKTNDSYVSFEVAGQIMIGEDGLAVEAVDGCLIATQYDIPWREDLFCGWDFYDVSQAIEFRKAGYLVKVPMQKKCWCFHDSGYQNLRNYEEERRIFVRQYSEYLLGNNLEKQVGFQLEQWNITQKIKEQLIQLFDCGEYEDLYVFLYQNYQKLSSDTELSFLRNVMEIWYEEQAEGSKTSFFSSGESWRDVRTRYQQVKFWLYQMEFGAGDGEARLADLIKNESISTEALVKFISHNTINGKEALGQFASIYYKMGNLKVADILRQLSSTLNKEKMAFIICCNDDQYQAECVSYLNELELPEAFEIEIISVTGAKSMAAGYNQGMKQTDAKYKVYLHQDVFIWNSRFIYDVLKIFENKAVGMIGVLGGVNIPNDGVLYRAWNVGMTYASDTQDTGIKQGKNPKQDICQEVEAVDGMLMATQYDLSWREDLFDGWDFYDISQSFEFRKAGYLVVVPHQEQPWCMHDCGRTKLQNYNQGRKKLLQEYACFFQNPIYREEDFFYNYDLKRQYQNMTDKIVQSMEQGLLDEAGLLCNQYDDAVIMDSELSILKKIISVCSVERELYGGVQSWHKGETYKTVKKRYYNLKFLLWDMERCRNSRKEGFVYVMKQDLYSIPFIVLVGIHHMFHFEQLLPVLAEYAVTGKDVKGLDYLKMIAQQISLAESIPFDVMRKELAPVPFFYKTKEEVSEIEKSWEIMAGVWEIELPEYRTRINRLLKEENRGELSALLASAEFCSKFDSVTDMAYMMIANQIYEEELQGGVNHTIFDGRSSIEEVMSLIQEIKFGLWRVEFDMEEAPGVQFIEMVRTHHISGYFLKYMVYVAGMDKVGLLGRLVAIFLECNMQGMAFSMLKYANELCPGTEEILGTMAELCIQVGKKEEAVYCLAQVKQPTQITEKLRKLCEET